MPLNENTLRPFINDYLKAKEELNITEALLVADELVEFIIDNL